MARPHRSPRERSAKLLQQGREDQSVSDALEGGAVPQVRPEPGTLPSNAFSLDFQAILTAIVRPEEAGGFSAEVPALPGCFTEGETLEELRDNLLEAADGWLKAHHELASEDLDRETRNESDER